MLDGAQELKDSGQVRKFLVAAPDLDKLSLIKRMLRNWQGLNIGAFAGKTYEIIRAAELCVVASGTATMETAYFETPMVVVYKVAPLSFLLGRLLVDVDYIGMVNLLAKKEVAPELIQSELNGTRIAETVNEILHSPERMESIRKDLHQIKLGLGGAGASERAARAILSEISPFDKHPPALGQLPYR